MKATSNLFLIGLALVALHPSLNAQALFQDDFNGSVDPAWSIVRPDVSFITQNPTELDLRASSGVLTGGANNAKNVFVITNPAAGDFVMTMRLNSFVPDSSNFAQIDLLAYDDDDNLVRAIYGYIGGVRRLELGREIGGGWSSSFTDHDFGNGSFYLRLTKVGNVYSESYSTDGTNFTDVNPTVTYGDGTPTSLGFVASDDPSESSVAHIDSLTVVPEPGTCGLVVLGIAGLIGYRRARSRA